MWPRTPDGVSRASPRPPCLTPPGSSDPVIQASQCPAAGAGDSPRVVAPASQCTPHRTRRASRLQPGHWPVPTFQPLSQVPRPPSQLRAAPDAPPSGSLLGLSLAAALGLLAHPGSTHTGPHSRWPALPMAGPQEGSAHEGPHPPRSPCVCPQTSCGSLAKAGSRPCRGQCLVSPLASEGPSCCQRRLPPRTLTPGPSSLLRTQVSAGECRSWGLLGSQAPPECRLLRSQGQAHPDLRASRAARGRRPAGPAG